MCTAALPIGAMRARNHGTQNRQSPCDGFIAVLKASAEYFQKLHVPKAISQMLPEVKIIASLRNPTDAFISKWLQVIKSDPKRVQAFEDKTGVPITEIKILDSLRASVTFFFCTGKPYHCDNVFREQMLDFKRCAVTGQDDIWVRHRSMVHCLLPWRGFGD